MIKRVLVALAAATTLTAAIGASGAAGGDRLLATPPNVCSALVQIRPDLYASFGECVGRLNRDVAAYRFPENPEDPSSPLLSLDERCTQFEDGIFDPMLGEFFQIEYPFFFVEPEGWPFPEYWAQNRQQCMNTLYAYHRFVGI